MVTFPKQIVPDEETRAGRMFAAGQLVATVLNTLSREHVTIKFRCIADNRDRQYDSNSTKNWIPCTYADATHVFVEVPSAGGEWADKIGTFYPRTGRWYRDDKADMYREECAAVVAHWVEAHDGVKTLPFEVAEESRCGVCGRELTDPVSIGRGIGPECYGKLTGSRHQQKDKVEHPGDAILEDRRNHQAGLGVSAQAQRPPLVVAIEAVNALSSEDDLRSIFGHVVDKIYGTEQVPLPRQATRRGEALRR